MKKLLLASAGVLALGVVSASAADLPRHRAMPEKAPVYVPPAWSWTGPYIGINGGWGFGRSDFSAPSPTGSFDTSGGLVGGTIGYNYQLDNNVVFGLEGDIDWSDIHGSAPCAGTTCETRNNWLGTARGRVGYSLGKAARPLGGLYSRALSCQAGLFPRLYRSELSADHIPEQKFG